MMFNDPKHYADAGHKAAIAQNVGDAATVKSWREHYQRMRSYETTEDRKKAEKIYSAAYAAARNVPKVA